MDEFTDDERQRESELTEPFDSSVVDDRPICPLCGTTVWLPWDIHSKVRCPNCGARVIVFPPLYPVNITKIQEGDPQAMIGYISDDFARFIAKGEARRRLEKRHAKELARLTAEEYEKAKKLKAGPGWWETDGGTSVIR